jgi:hypothetical protein
VAALERCITDDVLCQQMRSNARALLLRRYTFEATAIPALLAWAAAPSHAPDYKRDVSPLLAQTSLSAAPASMHISNDQFGIVQQTAVKVWRTLYALMMRLGVHPTTLRHVRDFGRNLFGVGYSSYAAAFLHHHVPTVMTVNTTVEVQVQALNRGRATWRTPENDAHPINLSYHWLSDEGVLQLKDGIRTPLKEDVSPGQEVAIQARIGVPSTPGYYQLEIDFVREGVNWLSEVGSKPLTVRVEVVEA